MRESTHHDTDDLAHNPRREAKGADDCHWDHEHQHADENEERDLVPAHDEHALDAVLGPSNALPATTHRTHGGSSNPTHAARAVMPHGPTARNSPHRDEQHHADEPQDLR
jgi:hypothetical protein